MAEILIIDDEGMRYTLSVLVRKLRLNPFSASSLAEGLHAASSTPFDVVLLDVNLPTERLSEIY